MLAEQQGGLHKGWQAGSLRAISPYPTLAATASSKKQSRLRRATPVVAPPADPAVGACQCCHCCCLQPVCCRCCWQPGLGEELPARVHGAAVTPPPLHGQGGHGRRGGQCRMAGWVDAKQLGKWLNGLFHLLPCPLASPPARPHSPHPTHLNAPPRVPATGQQSCGPVHPACAAELHAALLGLPSTALPMLWPARQCPAHALACPPLPNPHCAA